MSSQRLIASVMLWLIIGIVPMGAHALDVRLYLVPDDPNASPTLLAELTGAAAVNLDSNAPAGAARVYGGVFSIARCAGCAGRARVFVSDGDIDRLILTDALITNISSAPATLRIEIFSPEFTISGPEGLYPFVAEVSGQMGGAAPTTGNQVRARLRACAGGEGCDTIDRPADDTGETFQSQYSITVPPFFGGGLGGFGQTEDQLVFCSVPIYSDGETFLGNFCQHSLRLTVDITVPVLGSQAPCIDRQPVQQNGG